MPARLRHRLPVPPPDQLNGYEAPQVILHDVDLGLPDTESGVELNDMPCPRVDLYRHRSIWKLSANPSTQSGTVFLDEMAHLRYELRDLQAWSILDPHDTSRGWGDPDAWVGQGQEGFILGYQSLFLFDVKGYPLGRARRDFLQK